MAATQEYNVPLTERERLDDWYQKIKAMQAGFTLGTDKTTLMQKAKGMYYNDTLVIQDTFSVLGDG